MKLQPKCSSSPRRRPAPVAPDDPNRLSVDDAHILGVESATITGHTLKLIVLEPGAVRSTSTRFGLRWRNGSEPSRARRSASIHLDRSRAGSSTDFDICDHVRRRAETDCESRDDLWRAVSALMSEHLDRARPLWSFDVIGPLADGREAIAAESTTRWQTGSRQFASWTPSCGIRIKHHRSAAAGATRAAFCRRPHAARTRHDGCPAPCAVNSATPARALALRPADHCVARTGVHRSRRWPR